MSVVSGYRVAVDYGTSFTAAAVVDGSVPEVVEFASERHSRYLPSLVLVDQRGELHVGVRATAKRGAVPADHVCVAPKRQLGADPVQLGARSLTGAEVVGATLTKVAEEVLHQHNGVLPEELVMTHPATWSTARCELLTQAAVIAGLAADPAAVRLVSEPAAAVSFYAAAGTGPEVPVGGSVAVYDLGGGTFDCAVLTRTADGWVLAGPPGGDQHLGGEDFDEALLDWVAARILDKDPHAWESFEGAETPRGRRDWVWLLEEIKTAKEHLSHEEATEIGMPLGALPLDSLLITRTELTGLIGQALDRSMHAFEQCLNAAEITPSDLTAVYLTGGSSRIPAVKAELHRRFGLEPTTYKDPKTITALGALTHHHRPEQNSGTPPPTPGPGDKQFTIASAQAFREALEVATAMPGGVYDPVDAPVHLSCGEFSSLRGGDIDQFIAVPISCVGDTCELSVAPRELLAWMKDLPADEPVTVLKGDDVRFVCGPRTLSVTIQPAQWAFEDMRPGPPLAVVTMNPAAASTIQGTLHRRSESRLSLVLGDSCFVGGHFLQPGLELLETRLLEEVSGTLPRLPLLSLLRYIRSHGRDAGITLCAWHGVCEFSVELEDERLYAQFRTGFAAGAPPVRRGSSGTATVMVTPKSALGGLGALGVSFRVKVDGIELKSWFRGRKSWQSVVGELKPGRHTIEAYCTDFLKPGRASVEVEVVAGQELRLVYEQPATTVQKARLTVT